MELNKLNDNTIQIFGHYDGVPVSGFAKKFKAPYSPPETAFWMYNFSFMIQNTLYRQSSENNQTIKNEDKLHDHIMKAIDKEIVNIMKGN